MHRTRSTPKEKITRNVLSSERVLQIERFMTAGFASRPLGEVGGVSRNRLLVDKMIVWRTILGLIMASGWPAPESKSARRFSNDDAKGLVINANKLPRCALLRQESPARFQELGDTSGATNNRPATASNIITWTKAGRLTERGRYNTLINVLQVRMSGQKLKFKCAYIKAHKAESDEFRTTTCHRSSFLWAEACAGHRGAFDGDWSCDRPCRLNERFCGDCCRQRARRSGTILVFRGNGATRRNCRA
jgi:hypothetical protein